MTRSTAWKPRCAASLLTRNCQRTTYDTRRTEHCVHALRSSIDGRILRPAPVYWSALSTEYFVLAECALPELNSNNRTTLCKISVISQYPIPPGRRDNLLKLVNRIDAVPRQPHEDHDWQVRWFRRSGGNCTKGPSTTGSPESYGRAPEWNGVGSYPCFGNVLSSVCSNENYISAFIASLAVHGHRTERTL